MQPLVFYGNDRDLTQSKVLKYINNLDSDIFKTPDYTNVDLLNSKKSIGIDQVREVINKSATKPSYSSYKIFLFAKADLITVEAQNALLKTLEESPNYLLIIFCVNHYSQLIDTVVSRCRLIEVLADNADKKNGIVDLVADYQQAGLIRFDQVIQMSPGQRLDWVVQNKTLLAQKQVVFDLFDFWLREIDLCCRSEDVGFKDLSLGLIANDLFKYKKYLIQNVNPLMVIETFLYTIK